jgi:hypothetical protein
MAMPALEMETTTIVNKMAVAIHLMAAIVMASHHLHHKMTVDEHGRDTEMTGRIQDCHLDHRQQIIQLMTDRGNAQMVTGPDPVI